MPTDPITPALLSTERLAGIAKAVGLCNRNNATTALAYYLADVPALLGHVAALEAAARYVPVEEALPTNFNAEGRTDAMQVCTGGRVNIFPHNYCRGRAGRPGYWIQVGQPHHVTNVTHWREFPDDPARATGSAHLEALLANATIRPGEHGPIHDLTIGAPGTGHPYYGRAFGQLGIEPAQPATTPQ